MKKTSAFTLAETLITIGVIGIVAALTIPTVILNYKNKVYSSQLQKIYNQLSAATINFKSDNMVDSLDETYFSSGNLNNIKTFFDDYFKISSYCGATNRSGCFASSYTKGNNSISSRSIVGYCVLTNDQSSICINSMVSGISSVTVDVNGQKAPNIAGKDFFQFNLYNNGDFGGGDIESLINSGWEISD